MECLSADLAAEKGLTREGTIRKRESLNNILNQAVKETASAG
jgi:hypothetical protein